MTVRWKPLLILSALFVVVALGGLLAFTVVRGSRGTAGILVKARAERQAKRFAEAEIEFKRALQQDGQNPAIHMEFARLYEEWLPTAPTEKTANLEKARHLSLAEAARFGPTLTEPLRALLQEAVDFDEQAESVRRATELLKLEPTDPIAHYVIASNLLDETAPNLTEIRRHQIFIDKVTPRPVHALWLAARVAQCSKNDVELKTILTTSRSITEMNGLAPVDAISLFRLRALDAQTIDDPATLSARVAAVMTSAQALTSDAEISPVRLARVSRAIELLQKSLIQIKDRQQLDASIETVAESIFRKALATKGGADLGVFFAYADHLRFRDKRKECLEVIEQAFKAPLSRPASGDRLGPKPSCSCRPRHLDRQRRSEPIREIRPSHQGVA